MSRYTIPPATIAPPRSTTPAAQPQLPAPSATAWLPTIIGRQIIVHTIDDQTIRGLLSHVVADGLVLHAADYLGQSEVTPLGGGVFLPHHRVGFVQLPDTPAPGGSR